MLNFEGSILAWVRTSQCGLLLCWQIPTIAYECNGACWNRRMRDTPW